jgi:hypothetical protein
MKTKALFVGKRHLRRFAEQSGGLCPGTALPLASTANRLVAIQLCGAAAVGKIVDAPVSESVSADCRALTGSGEKEINGSNNNGSQFRQST